MRLNPGERTYTGTVTSTYPLSVDGIPIRAQDVTDLCWEQIRRAKTGERVLVTTRPPQPGRVNWRDVRKGETTEWRWISIGRAGR